MTCAALLTRRVYLKVVSEMLSYADTSITLNTYSHIIPGMGDVAAGTMEEVLD